jgi:hypothetical protein
MPLGLLEGMSRKPLRKATFLVQQGRLYEIVNGKDSEGVSEVPYSAH